MNEHISRIIRDRAINDERTIERWILNGMRGRLVRKTPDAPVTVEPCPPEEDGRWVIEIRSEGGWKE